MFSIGIYVDFAAETVAARTLCHLYIAISTPDSRSGSFNHVPTVEVVGTALCSLQKLIRILVLVPRNVLVLSMYSINVH